MGRVIDRYRLEARLGSGGGGEVYRARDGGTGDVVALKLVPYEGEGEEGLRAEFEVASSLRHPNIVRVREYGFAGGKSYFTMDVVEGAPIVEHLVPLDLVALYRLASQLCSALAYLHGRGLLHGDLKPSNVLVVGHGTEARVQLLDFGLARHRRQLPDNAGGGTIGYMAPETVATGRCDVQSELYSLGALLYHVVSQTPPIGAAPDDFDRALHGRGLPPVLERAPGLEAGWAKLVDQLVAREPGARPVSAIEVQDMLDAWAEAHGTGRVGPAVRTPERPVAAIGGALVGRTAEIDRLMAAVEGAAAGRGRLVFVHGESGIGKTRLLEEIRGRAQIARARVVWTRCAAGDRAPLALATEVVRRLAPVLRDSAVEPDAAPLASEDGRLQVLARAAEIVIDAAGSRPLVVVVDDVHEADRDAADFLRALAFRLATSAVLLVAAGRDERLPHGLQGDLEGESFVEALALERLPLADVRDLVRAALGEVEGETPVLGEAVHRASGGNPLLAEEALRAWVDAGALVRARGAWVLRAEPLRRARLPAASVRDAVAARVDRLGPGARKVLAAAGVFGDRIDVAMLADVVGGSRARLHAALGELVAQRILVSDGGRRYHFAQGLVRQVVEDRTALAERQRLHRRALDVLVRRRDAGEAVAIEELARHAVDAQDAERGPTLCREAARAAERACALERAIEWNQALLAFGAQGGTALQILESIADLALVVGRADTAVESLDRALGLAIAPARWRLSRKRAEAHLLGGDPRRALAEADAALAAAPEEPDDQLELQIVRVRALTRCGDDLGLALAACDEAARHARLLERPGREQYLENLRGSALSLQGRAAEAVVSLRRAARFARAAGDELRCASAQNNLSMAYYFLGRNARALAAARAAARTARRRGAVTLLAKCHNQTALAALALGRWDEAESALREYAGASELSGNRWGRVAALGNQALLARCRGDLGRAILLGERRVALAARWKLPWLHANALQLLSTTRRLSGELSASRVALAEARLVAGTLRATRLQLEIEACEAELLVDEGDRAQARKVVRAALQAVSGTVDAELRPHLLVVLAKLERLEGRLPEARTAIDEARALFAEKDNPLDQARAEIERAHVCRAAGALAEAQSSGREAHRGFDRLGARLERVEAEALLESLRVSASPTEPADGNEQSLRRLSALLDASRALTGVVDLGRLLERVIEHAVGISGAERALLVVLQASGERRVQVAHGLDETALDGPELRVSRGLIEQVLASGESVCVTDAATDLRVRAHRSVQALGLRSVLCLPLATGDRLIGALYLDSTHTADALAHADQATLEALATQAAAAIESARLYEDLRGKNELIGILAHELRTPLAALLGYAQLLEREDARRPIPRERYLQAVLQHGRRLDRIIDQVLDLSRLGAERAPWAIRPLDPRELVRGTLESLEPLAWARELTIVPELPEQLPAVEADADRLVQVVSNLVSNAIQYSEPGGKVTVSAREAVMPGERRAIEIRVRDEGPGIPSGDIASVFDPFARGSQARPGGAGLGLHVCQLVVRRHGGRIWVESKNGAGSTFVFQIPAMSPDEPSTVAAG